MVKYNSNFWIIGNGFDLAHRLPTTYRDFSNFLCDYNRGLYETLINGNNMIWSNVESGLGELDYDDCISVYLDDIEYDDDYSKAAINMLEDLSGVSATLDTLSENLKEWILSISIDNVEVKREFENILKGKKNYFLNFNYTDTLVRLYDIDEEDICHLHGSAYEEDVLIMGHNAPFSEDIDKENLIKSLARSRYYSNFCIDDLYDIEYKKQYIIESLRKDTDKAYNRYEKFFDKLGCIDAIYSYGFSYGNADDYYIDKIISILNNRDDAKEVVWYVHNYNEESTKKIFDKIMSLGYLGKLSKFNC